MLLLNCNVFVFVFVFVFDVQSVKRNRNEALTHTHTKREIEKEDSNKQCVKKEERVWRSRKSNTYAMNMNGFHRFPLRFLLPAVSCCQVIINLIPMVWARATQHILLAVGIFGCNFSLQIFVAHCARALLCKMAAFLIVCVHIALGPTPHWRCISQVKELRQ